ncbi:Extracellular matrix regulatory protein A [Firmicutes bacterium ASF500]|nr:Extracellular matrix regulatory protein A [Firmicutes bacterium ASF500]
MKLVNIGFGSLVSAGRLVAVVSPESAPIKRMTQEARERGVLIDATYGRRTQAVLIMDNDHVVLSALTPEVIAGRLEGGERPGAEEEL